MRLSRTHHVAIICSNYEISRHFYTEILGLEVVAEVYRDERRSYKLDLRIPDGTQIELFSFTDPPRRPSYPEACGLRHLAFEVEDVDQAVRDLRAAGVEVEQLSALMNTRASGSRSLPTPMACRWNCTSSEASLPRPVQPITDP